MITRKPVLLWEQDYDLLKNYCKDNNITKVAQLSNIVREYLLNVGYIDKKGNIIEEKEEGNDSK